MAARFSALMSGVPTDCISRERPRAGRAVRSRRSRCSPRPAAGCATATVDHATQEVHASSLSPILGIRLEWQGYPQCALYNGQGGPDGPFCASAHPFEWCAYPQVRARGRAAAAPRGPRQHLLSSSPRSLHESHRLSAMGSGRHEQGSYRQQVQHNQFSKRQPWYDWMDRRCSWYRAQQPQARRRLPGVSIHRWLYSQPW